MSRSVEGSRNPSYERPHHHHGPVHTDRTPGVTVRILIRHHPFHPVKGPGPTVRGRRRPIGVVHTFTHRWNDDLRPTPRRSPSVRSIHRESETPRVRCRETVTIVVTITHPSKIVILKYSNIFDRDRVVT